MISLFPPPLPPRRLLPLLVAAALLLAALLAAALALRSHSRPGGAIALSFDDRSSIHSWGDARDFLRKNGIRATFFVDRFDALSPEQLAILRQLAADGHEIGSHGFRHLNARDFIRRGDSVVEYLETEILPSIDHMARHGFLPRSFAYPHGVGTEETDRALAGLFAMVRKVGGESIFHDGTSGPFVGARYLDHPRVERAVLEGIADQARKSRAAASLSGHKIGLQGGNYWCSFETLETLAQVARERRLPFLTMSELPHRPR